MYALIYADGMTSIAVLQSMLGSEPIYPTLAAAEDGFREICRETMRDGIPTDEGGPWAQVCDADSWDGLTYTDEGYQLTVGPRGGVSRRPY